jgi:hypothetical protein
MAKTNDDEVPCVIIITSTTSIRPRQHHCSVLFRRSRRKIQIRKIRSCARDQQRRPARSVRSRSSHTRRMRSILLYRRRGRRRRSSSRDAKRGYYAVPAIVVVVFLVVAGTENNIGRAETTTAMVGMLLSTAMMTAMHRAARA